MSVSSTFYIFRIYDLAGGTVKLASSDPFAKPLIDPKFLTTTFDKVALRKALKGIKRFVKRMTNPSRARKSSSWVTKGSRRVTRERSGV